MPNNVGITLEQLNMAAQQGREFTDKVVAAEAARATGVEDLLKTALGDESSRAKSIEKELLSKITAETNRAVDTESALAVKLDDEIKRATNAEHIMSSGFIGDIADVKDGLADLKGKLSDENIRAVAAEDSLEGRLKTEVDRSIETDALIQRQLTDEIARATDIESGLGARITDEANRAQSVESKLVQAITAEKETRSSEIGALQVAVSTEVSRASGMEQALQLRIAELEVEANKHVGMQADIDGEIARATAAEKDIQDSLGAEIAEEVSRAKAAEADISEKLANGIKTLISEDVNLGAQIKDETARATAREKAIAEKLVEETTRAIGAEDAITTDLDEFKTMTGDRFGDVDTKLDAEVTRATGAEAALSVLVGAETQRATAAENDLNGKIEQETERAVAAEENLDEKIDIEKNRAIAAEDAITAAYTEADRLESETRSSQFTGLKEDIIDQSNRITSETAAINQKIEDTNAQVNKNVNAIKTLTDGSVSKIRLTGADGRNPFSLVFMNSADEILESLKIAFDPADTTYAEKSLVNRKYVGAVAATLSSALEAESTRAKTTESVLDKKIKDEIARAKDAEGSIIGATDNLKKSLAESVSTLNFKIEEETTRSTDADGALEKLINDTADVLVAKNTFKGDVVTLIEFLHGTGILSTEISGVNPTTLATTKYGIEIISTDDTVKATFDDSDPKNIRLDLSVPLAGDLDALLDEKIGKSVVGSGKKLLVDLTYTATENVHSPATGGGPKEPEYGSTLSFVKKTTNVDSGAITEKTKDFNLFKLSGAQNIMEELYDEIARAKLAEENLEKKIGVAGTSGPAPTDVSDLQTAIDDEVTRAKSAEEILDSNIKAEVTRSKAAEKATNNTIDSVKSSLDEVKTSVGDVNSSLSEVKESVEDVTTALAVVKTVIDDIKNNFVVNVTLPSSTDTFTCENPTGTFPILQIFVQDNKNWTTPGIYPTCTIVNDDFSKITIKLDKNYKPGTQVKVILR